MTIASVPKWLIHIIYLSGILPIISCDNMNNRTAFIHNNLPANILNYTGSPSSPQDRKPLVFSDQGAWFGYGFSSEVEYYGGFSGPFLMTQENGVWSSRVLSQLMLTDKDTGKSYDWKDFTISQKSYNSHLEQIYENDSININQWLFFSSPHTAFMITRINNTSDHIINLKPVWRGNTYLKSLHIHKNDQTISITSNKSTAMGYIQILDDSISNIQYSDTAYTIELIDMKLDPGETKQLLLTHSFIFSEYSHSKEQQIILSVGSRIQGHFQSRITDKENQLQKLYNRLDANWSDPNYKDLLAKSILTLQNNWRIPSGELKHSGLFPSYHYIWFHGFWAWDSWKHSVALAQYHTELAKEQIRAMYDFQNEDGFIADCVYRDTTIENHNYRNTKPPLSAWAIWEIYRQDRDINFLIELYPKVLKQHRWWYINRDHDKDGICEYGSTDGTLIAAKWESGMDNAVRFDNSKILQNSEKSFSLGQESVDLNAYLYAEKKYLNKIAQTLGYEDDAKAIEEEAITLKSRIQKQFFDSNSGWFYDTSLDGKNFILAMGCEGWIPLWANAATKEQAEAVKNNMIDPELFNTKVPFQTLSAIHPKFKPDGGYWRGPTWLDQAYFGVKGLQNYGYHQEANEATHKLIHNAEGVLSRGTSIRENYNPITGEGHEAENFSWSAAHYLLLLIGN